MKDKAFIDPETYAIDSTLELDIEPESEIFGSARRVTATATLDGGIEMSDTGAAEGDRTITLIINAPSVDVLTALVNLSTNYDYLTVGLLSGQYRCKMSRWKSFGNRCTITLLVKTRMDS